MPYRIRLRDIGTEGVDRLDSQYKARTRGDIPPPADVKRTNRISTNNGHKERFQGPSITLELEVETPPISIKTPFSQTRTGRFFSAVGEYLVRPLQPFAHYQSSKHIGGLYKFYKS